MCLYGISIILSRYICTSVDPRRQGRRVIRLVGPLSILRPTPKSSKRTQKYAVPAVTRSPLCRDADVPEWQASLWEGDKRVFKTSLLSQLSPTSLLSDWGARQRLSQGDEQRQRAGDAF